MADAPEHGRCLLQAELDRLVAIVAEQLRAERVVLFGSFAQGRVHSWSDLDVVVVAPTDAPFYVIVQTGKSEGAGVPSR